MTPTDPHDTAFARRSPHATPRPESLCQLFTVFCLLALRGFGGVLPWAQRALVEEQRWLTREQFLETLAFGQLFPGPNVCNVAIMVGDRWFGWRGSVVALAGMLAAPMVLVLSLGVLYTQVADEPVVRRALAGMGAVAGGMILATGFKLALTQRARWRWLAFGVASFIGVGLLKLKMLVVLLALAPLAVGIAVWVLRRDRAAPRSGTKDRGDSGASPP
jgi:chromate transporter